MLPTEREASPAELAFCCTTNRTGEPSFLAGMVPAVFGEVDSMCVFAAVTIEEALSKKPDRRSLKGSRADRMSSLCSCLYVVKELFGLF